MRWVLSFIRARIISGHFRARSLEKSDCWVWFKFALFCCLCRRCCSISVTECVGRTAWIQPFFMGSQNPNRSGIKVDWCINPGCQVIVALGKKFYWKLKVSPFFLYRDWQTEGCRAGEGPPITELEDVYRHWMNFGVKYERIASVFSCCATQINSRQRTKVSGKCKTVAQKRSRDSWGHVNSSNWWLSSRHPHPANEATSIKDSWLLENV